MTLATEKEIKKTLLIKRTVKMYTQKNPTKIKEVNEAHEINLFSGPSTRRVKMYVSREVGRLGRTVKN